MELCKAAQRGRETSEAEDNPAVQRRMRIKQARRANLRAGRIQTPYGCQCMQRKRKTGGDA